MAGPELADPDEPDTSADSDDGMEMPDADTSGLGFDGVEDSEDGDFEVGEVDLGIGEDDDIVEGFEGFDGTEDATDSGEDTSDHGDDGWTGQGGGGGSQAGPDGVDVDIAFAINSGMARLSATGLPDQQQQVVQEEMYEIADSFYLGYFGERCVQKYLKTDLQNIPPEYGLAASLIAFLAIAIYKRPDGTDRVQEAVTALKHRLNNRGSADAETEDSDDDE